MLEKWNIICVLSYWFDLFNVFGHHEFVFLKKMTQLTKIYFFISQLWPAGVFLRLKFLLKEKTIVVFLCFSSPAVFSALNSDLPRDPVVNADKAKLPFDKRKWAFIILIQGDNGQWTWVWFMYFHMYAKASLAPARHRIIIQCGI